MPPETRGDVLPTPTKRPRAPLGPRLSSANSVSSPAQKRGCPNTANSQTQQNLPPLPLHKSNKEVVAELKAVLEDDLRKQKALEASIASRIKNIKGLAGLEKRVLEANDLHSRIQANLQQLSTLEKKPHYVKDGPVTASMHYNFNEEEVGKWCR